MDQKLARILAGPACRDFIIADAKEADMAFGLASPGRSPEHHAHEGRFRTPGESRQLMREIVRPPKPPGDEPDFSKMTPAEKAQWNIERWKRIMW